MDEQPRDDKGQFASTGGGGASGGGVEKPLAEKYPGLKGATKKELKEFNALHIRVATIQRLANEAKAKGDVVGMQAGVTVLERYSKQLAKAYDTIAKRQDKAADGDLKAWAKKKSS